jgi:flavin reductase (DIM6/NTAB) family NADH-FMN oxidoreductase RutF
MTDAKLQGEIVMNQKHVFQPMPIYEMDFNPFRQFKEDTCAIVTEVNGKANAMTASWGAMGEMWGKDVITIYVRESRFTRELLDQSETFSINFFDMDKIENKMALQVFGSESGRDTDKIAEMKFNVNHSLNTPFLDESNLVFLCSKLSRTEIKKEDFFHPRIDSKFYENGDYHIMYIAEIMRVGAR